MIIVKHWWVRRFLLGGTKIIKTRQCKNHFSLNQPSHVIDPHELPFRICIVHTNKINGRKRARKPSTRIDTVSLTPYKNASTSKLSPYNNTHSFFSLQLSNTGKNLFSITWLSFQFCLFAY